MATSGEPMTDRQYVTITMPGPWVESIDAELVGTDSRSEWIRQAIREKMQRDGLE
jgi:metal-responsive CopG/Arc/MetJ family transcriptional regulator